MPSETTVLLIRPISFPAGLEGQMTKRGAFVEVSEIEDAVTALPMVGPDIAVLATAEGVEELLANMAKAGVDVPLVVVADWREHRALRAKTNGKVGALVPADLPAIALAQRLIALAERASRGEALQPSPSVRPPAEEKPAAKTASGLGQDSKETPTLATPASGAAAVAAVVQARLTPKEPEETKRNPPLVAAQKPGAKASLGPAKPEEKPKNVESKGVVPKPVTTEPSTTPGTGAASPNKAPIAAQKPEPQKAKPAIKQTIIGLGPADLGLDALVAKPEKKDEKPAPKLESSSPAIRNVAAPSAAPANDSIEKKAGEGESTLTSLDHLNRKHAPVAERVPLTASQRVLPPVRLGVVDRNLTRAGAIVEALTARGLRAQLVGVDEDQTRWRLFRRFAPQGIVIDEGALEEATTWLDALRLDPFLGHVPLVPIRYEALFAQESGKVDLGFLIPLVTSLGNEERAIGDILSPLREIEFRLHQVGVHALLAALGERGDTIEITCREDECELRFFVHAGTLGEGTLSNPGKKVEIVTGGALVDWLLAHPQARIVLRVDSAAKVKTGAAIEPLLVETTTEEAVPVAPRRPTARSLRPPSMPRHTAPPPEIPEELEVARDSELPPRGAPPRPPMREKLRSLALETRPRLVAFAAKAKRVRKEIWFGSATVVALGAGALVWSGRIKTSEAPPLIVEKKLEAAPIVPKVLEKNVTSEASYFVLGPEVDSPSCETLAGPSNEPASSAPIYLRQGRKALVAGDVEKALAFLCRAATLDSSPVPAESVAGLYLARRNHTQAEHWANVALTRESGRRTALELLADIEADRGNTDVALARLLESMRLTEADMLKRAAVARNLIKESRVLEKAGDRPRAGRLLKRAYLLEPGNGENSTRLASYYSSAAEPAMAERWARRALERSGDTSEARLLLAELLVARGERSEAAEVLSKVGLSERLYDRAQERLKQLK